MELGFELADLAKVQDCGRRYVSILVLIELVFEQTGEVNLAELQNMFLSLF